MRHRSPLRPPPPRACVLTMPLVALLAIAACGSPARDVLTLPTAPASTVPMGSDFTLAPGESVVVNSGALTLSFVGVTNDSRCPTNALILCVWAGSARIALRATSAAGTRDVALETVADKETAIVDGFVVQLVSVSPVPLTTDPIPAGAYRVTLRMARKH